MMTSKRKCTDVSPQPEAKRTKLNTPYRMCITCWRDGIKHEASYGFEYSGKRSYCAKHGKELGAFNVAVKRCEDCLKSGKHPRDIPQCSFGLAYKCARWCKKCAAKYIAFDVRVKRCEDCLIKFNNYRKARRAQNGLKYGRKYARWCIECGIQHNAFNVCNKRCEDCLKANGNDHRNAPQCAYGLIFGRKHARWCSECGIKHNAFNVYDKRCEDCLKANGNDYRNTPRVSYGIAFGRKHARWCAQCAIKYDAFDVCNKRCEDCLKANGNDYRNTPVCTCGLTFGINARWCSECGIKHNAFNVFNKRCEDCLKANGNDHRNTSSAAYGIAYGSKHAKWCAQCAIKYDAFDVRNKRCEDCLKANGNDHRHTVLSTYGHTFGSKHARWCAQCATKYDAFDVCKKRCEDCLKANGNDYRNTPVCRYGLTCVRWCSQCAVKYDAFDASAKRCEDCINVHKKHPRDAPICVFGLTYGKKAQWCSDCAQQHEGAFNVSKKQCEHSHCRDNAYWTTLSLRLANDISKHWCLFHIPSNEQPARAGSNICTVCHMTRCTEGRKQCSRCSGRRNIKTEQTAITAILRTWIKQAHPGDAFYGCRLYNEFHLRQKGLRYCFVDIYVVTPNGCVIAIEVDERQHKRNSNLQERLREVFIAMMIRYREQKPLTIYRINPHTYKNGRVKGPYANANVATKMAALHDDLAALISGLSWDIHTHPWQVLFRYYDNTTAQNDTYRHNLAMLVKANTNAFSVDDYKLVLAEIGIQ